MKKSDHTDYMQVIQRQKLAIIFCILLGLYLDSSKEESRHLSLAFSLPSPGGLYESKNTPFNPRLHRSPLPDLKKPARKQHRPEATEKIAAESKALQQSEFLRLSLQKLAAGREYEDDTWLSVCLNLFIGYQSE